MELNTHKCLEPKTEVLTGCSRFVIVGSCRHSLVIGHLIFHDSNCEEGCAETKEAGEGSAELSECLPDVIKLAVVPKVSQLNDDVKV